MAEDDLEWGSKEDGSDRGGEAPAGSYVVRLDQPYRVLVRVLLDVQEFPKDATPPYDDTGWTLPFLHHVDAIKVDDPSILSADMRQVTQPAGIAGGLDRKGRDYYLVNNTTDDNFTLFRFKLSDVTVLAAEAGFEADKKSYSVGSFIIPAEGNPEDLGDRIEAVANELNVSVHGVGRRPDVGVHEVEVPRVALVHTWVSTPQDAGWWRFAFDHIGIPYTYLSEQDLATHDLSQLDVIIMPSTRANPQTLVAGTTEAGPPIPWENSGEYSSIGIIDQTEDVRRGMGYDGLKNLKSFVEGGGVFITEGRTAAFPIDMAMIRRVSIRRTNQLLARGTILKAVVDDEASPIVYGYPETMPIYFSQAPVFEVSKDLSSPFIPDWMKDEYWEKEVPRTVLSFAKQDIFMSGMLRGESEIAGTPAVLDVPVGEGHVVLFANRPFWRWQTRGTHALVFNTMLHWNDLRTGWPVRPGAEESTTVAGGQ
jgi:hypothetical protein